MSPKHCIVIGAGLAGLVSADRLKKHGWSATVIEAQRRLGGRIRTHRFKQASDLHCELGAEWIAEEHNTMKWLCSRFSLELVPHRHDFFFVENSKCSRTIKAGGSPYSRQGRKVIKSIKRALAGGCTSQDASWDRLFRHWGRG